MAHVKLVLVQSIGLATNAVQNSTPTGTTRFSRLARCEAACTRLLTGALEGHGNNRHNSAQVVEAWKSIGHQRKVTSVFGLITGQPKVEESKQL